MTLAFCYLLYDSGLLRQTEDYTTAEETLSPKIVYCAGKTGSYAQWNPPSHPLLCTKRLEYFENAPRTLFDASSSQTIGHQSNQHANWSSSSSTSKPLWVALHLLSMMLGTMVATMFFVGHVVELLRMLGNLGV